MKTQVYTANHRRSTEERLRRAALAVKIVLLGKLKLEIVSTQTIQVSPAFQKLVFHHFIFIKDFHQYRFQLPKRNPKRVSAFKKKGEKGKQHWQQSVCSKLLEAAGALLSSESGTTKLLPRILSIKLPQL